MIVRPNNPHNRLSVIPDYARNRKKPHFSIIPRGNSPQNPKNRPFLTEKVTFFVIFQVFSTNIYPSRIILVPLSSLAPGESIPTVFLKQPPPPPRTFP